jgi:poly(ADP-ribose) glycohydrolase ARH3
MEQCTRVYDEGELSTLCERFQGCLLGLALGDAFNAPLEGGVIERLVWRMIGSTPQGERRYTDDTQMSLDLAKSLIACGELDLDDVATRFAASYQWSRGYGPGAAKLLKRVRRGEAWREVNTAIFPGGSWGNGGAMRAPVIGLRCVHTPDVMEDWARGSAQVTHAHELGMQGAAMMAAATAEAVRGGGD